MVNMINHYTQAKLRILNSAVELSNYEGWDSLSVKRIADHLSFTSASIYKHFESFGEIKLHMCMICFQELNAILTKALSFNGSSKEKIEYFSVLLRKFSLKKPGLFQSSMFRSEKEPEDLVKLRRKSQEILVNLFSDYSVPDENKISVSRSLRSLLFGSLLLEIRESFGTLERPEKSYKEAIDLFLMGISSKYPIKVVQK